MHESGKWKWSHSVVFRLFMTPWTAASQAPPSIGFSKQEYWSRVSLPSPCRYLCKHIKKQRYYFANKGLSSQGYGFSSGHVWMWELDCEESWAPKNWCFLTVVLEKTLESPLDCKEIQPVHPKGDQSWVFIGKWKWSHSVMSDSVTLWTEGLMLKLKLQYFGHLMRSVDSLEKTLMLGGIGGRRRRGRQRMRWLDGITD